MHLFHGDADLEAFQHDVIEALRRDPIHMLSYCILSNDWHLVVWPETDGQVTKKKGHAMRANASRMGAGAT
jgi:putative transposase